MQTLRRDDRNGRGAGSLAAAALALALAPLAAPALAQRDGAPAALAPPRRFERVLWCGDADRGPALAKRLGYTAVQLGRGGDPAPLEALGLGYYLDQPIGKGLLELRDSDWQPVVQAFERTRDAAALVRPGCFAEPGRVAAAAAAAADEARRVHRPGLLFVALADEASATRHGAPLDTCRCVHCVAAFRREVAARFGKIEALNGALGSHFATFDDVVPLSTDQVRLRELGDRQLPVDLRPFAIWLDFVDAQFAGAVHALHERVAAAVPGVPVGLTGLSVPGAFGGHDYERLLPGLTLLEPYDIGGAVELARSLGVPGAHRYATLGPPDAGPGAAVPLTDLVRAHLAAMACQGLAGVVVWNDGTVAANGEPTPFGAAVAAAFARLGPALDACAGAAVEASPVWILESHASVRLWWMLDSAGDGMTWVRRLASYESEHSTSQAARRSWIRLLQDLGLEPQFVGERALPERLLLERPRCVVLPATIALADRSAQALMAYVQSGGTVIADHSVGLYDDALLRRDAGALDALFGVASRSLAWDDLLVREGRSTARAADGPSGLAPAERALRGELGDSRRFADTFLERVHGRGRACYLNAPVVEYGRWRLDEQAVGPAFELRRRVRSALQRAGALPPCDVRGDGLPTLLERVPLRLRDGRRLLAIRVNALERPALLQRLAREGPVPVEIVFPTELRLAVFGSGDPLVTTARLNASLDPFAALFLEVGP